MKTTAKRKTKYPCSGCGLNPSFCICAFFIKQSLKTRIDLVVHYKELKRTTNTGRLIESLLENHGIWVRGLQDSPLDHSEVFQSGYEPLLLYPSDDALVLDQDFVKSHKSNKPFQVIVPDGNWRQASKVHYRVEEFKAIPRIKLSGARADRGPLVRAESKIDGMSTLEAIAYVVEQIEGVEAAVPLIEAYKLKKTQTLRARGFKNL